jgi:hypothetical protein
MKECHDFNFFTLAQRKKEPLIFVYSYSMNVTVIEQTYSVGYGFEVWNLISNKPEKNSAIIPNLMILIKQESSADLLRKHKR